VSTETRLFGACQEWPQTPSRSSALGFGLSLDKNHF
jgi:hypothetical protein